MRRHPFAPGPAPMFGSGATNFEFLYACPLVALVALATDRQYRWWSRVDSASLWIHLFYQHKLEAKMQVQNQGVWKIRGTVETLIDLQGNGQSATYIASILNEKFEAYGVSVTRNSVIGKIHRLGLVSPKENHHNPGTRSRKRKLVGRGQNAHLTRKVEKLLQALPELPKVPLPAPAADPMAPRHISIFELGDNTCRFPYGDESFTFCGHGVKDGSAYCPHHHERSHDGRRKH